MPQQLSQALFNHADIRPQLKAKRQLISPFQRNLSARRAARAVLKHHCFKASKHIAVYYANSQELDTKPLINAILKAKKRCYLPCIQQQRLVFRRYGLDTVLAKHPQYFIPQPKRATSRAAQRIDLIIAPLLAFDLRGTRLGMGGGYYDRSLQFKKRVSRPLFIGYGFSSQHLHYIPRRPWDVRLDALIHNKSLYFTRLAKH